MRTVHNQAAKGKIKVGDAAPNFTLPTQAGSTASLNDFLSFPHNLHVKNILLKHSKRCKR